jgi:hypothetical protein
MKALLERLTLGIQARLVILVLATVLPLVGLASFAIIRTVDNERTRIQRDAKERVADLLANVDRQITSIQAELRVLAVSPSLQSGDFAAFDRQMREALKIQGTSIVLHDTKAQQRPTTWSIASAPRTAATGGSRPAAPRLRIRRGRRSSGSAPVRTSKTSSRLAIR